MRKKTYPVLPAKTDRPRVMERGICTIEKKKHREGRIPLDKRKRADVTKDKIPYQPSRRWGRSLA